MKLFKNCIMLILTITLSVGICACSNQADKINTLTNRFENSCNKIDLNAMLDCIDPDISKGVKAVTGIIGMFSDTDTDELLDEFAKVLFTELPENSKEFFSSINITLDNVEIEENSAYALGDISYEISGEDYKTNAKFEYICIDEEWYISNLDIK